MRSPDRLEYQQRVNRVIDHIRAHLAEELSLAALARIATFSPFHFHRVFKAITPEPPFAFVQRMRLETAAAALRDQKDRSVLEIALDHGFGSSATFARAFRAHFGMTATDWRAGGARRWGDARQSERNPGKHLGNPGKARRPGAVDAPPRGKEDRRMNVQIRQFAPHHVAYMRYVGPYGARGIPELWQRFTKWMDAHDFTRDATIRLGVAYDDSAITAAEQCRYDACVVVSPE